MAVTSRELRNERRPLMSVQSDSVNSLAYIVTGVLALLAVYVVLSNLVAWGTIKYDDLVYGRPRTFHLTAPVGNSAEMNGPSHFIGINLNRQVIVLYLPGGDASQVHTIIGPYLFGAGEDLTPVSLRLADVNGNAIPDLIVRVKNEEIIYINRGDTFELITAEERQQLARQYEQR